MGGGDARAAVHRDGCGTRTQLVEAFTQLGYRFEGAVRGQVLGGGSGHGTRDVPGTRVQGFFIAAIAGRCACVEYQIVW
ncbi:Uncharacterised protein [Mycobacteroides abscessus subsp. abscessus]|nr:Uncharacterised protein [Mycobacteroides abscessus subsp. abscessus]